MVSLSLTNLLFVYLVLVDQLLAPFFFWFISLPPFLFSFPLWLPLFLSFFPSFFLSINSYYLLHSIVVFKRVQYCRLFVRLSICYITSFAYIHTLIQLIFALYIIHFTENTSIYSCLTSYWSHNRDKTERKRNQTLISQTFQQQKLIKQTFYFLELH